MARLQMTVSDDVDKILSQFDSANNRRLFIECAIRFAIENKEICTILGIKPQIQLNNASTTESRIKHDVISAHSTNHVVTPKSEENNLQIEIDPEFDDR